MAHVLLIEPDRLLARTYRQAIEHAGHSVSVSHSAQTAVDTADTHKPDVVVLELQLAVHDGVEFLYEFRSYGEWQTVPVLIHSGIPPQTIEPVKQSLQDDLGVAGIMYKPQTSLEELIRQINRQVHSV